MHKRTTISGATKTLASVLILGSSMMATAQVQELGSAASVEQSFSAIHQALSVTANDLLASAQRPSAVANSWLISSVPISGAALPSLGQTGRVSQLQKAQERVDALRPALEPILREEGVPLELSGVVLVESGGVPTALSPRGARGIWQFMPDTARRYGLTVTPEVDERLDILKSTRAAARYLRDLYSQLGNWPLAFAAYNAGEELVGRAAARTRSRDFNVIAGAGLLPLETRNYVPAVMSAVEVMKGTVKNGPFEGQGIGISQRGVVYALRQRQN